MPQRGNSCHYPEVTIQLNRNFYFIFYNRSKDQAQRPTLGSIVWTWCCLPRAVEPHRALSLPWVLDHCRCVWCESPHSPAHVLGDQCYAQEDWGTPASQPGWAELWLCGCRWAGIWALPCTCTASEMPVRLTEAVHTVTAHNSANTHCTQNWNLNPGVCRTTRAYKAPIEAKKPCEWAMQLFANCFLPGF